MPNHCHNRVEIYGEPEELAKIKKQVETKETLFDFTKIYPEPDYEKIEVTPTFEKDEEDDFRMPSWWDWRVQNWGTKWNSYECDLELDDLDMLRYTFDTAWGPPVGVIDKLRELYPEVSVTAFYDEPGMEVAGYL